MSEEITEAMIKAVFDDLDVDKSNTLSLTEIQSHGLPLLNLDLTEEEFMALGDGEDLENMISLEAFTKLIQKAFQKHNPREEMLKAFKKFDTDDKGYIPKEKMKKILMTPKEEGADDIVQFQFEEDEADDLLKTMDVTGDGKFNILEMLSLMFFVRDDEGQQEDTEEQKVQEQE